MKRDTAQISKNGVFGTIPVGEKATRNYERACLIDLFQLYYVNLEKSVECL